MLNDISDISKQTEKITWSLSMVGSVSGDAVTSVTEIDDDYLSLSSASANVSITVDKISLTPYQISGSDGGSFAALSPTNVDFDGQAHAPTVKLDASGVSSDAKQKGDLEKISPTITKFLGMSDATTLIGASQEDDRTFTVTDQDAFDEALVEGSTVTEPGIYAVVVSTPESAYYKASEDIIAGVYTVNKSNLTGTVTVEPVGEDDDTVNIGDTVSANVSIISPKTYDQSNLEYLWLYNPSSTNYYPIYAEKNFDSAVTSKTFDIQNKKYYYTTDPTAAAVEWTTITDFTTASGIYVVVKDKNDHYTTTSALTGYTSYLASVVKQVSKTTYQLQNTIKGGNAGLSFVYEDGKDDDENYNVYVETDKEGVYGKLAIPSSTLTDVRNCRKINCIF